jgi:hypothetical protein
LAYTSPISLSSTATVAFSSRDRANIAESPKTQVVQIDTQAPVNNVSASVVTGAAYATGSTVFYRGSAAGSLRLTNSVSDAGGSGPASSATSALAGPKAGWTHTASAVSTPAGGPYASGLFRWTAGTTSSPRERMTASDVAGNTSTTSPALTFRNDSTAPTTTASVAPAPNAAGWNTAAATVTLSASDNAGGSGVAAVTYTTDGSSPATSPTAIAYAGPFTVSSTVTILYSAADRVSNTAAVASRSVKVDAVDPTPALALSAVSGGAFRSGGTIFYRGVAAGSFRLTNTVVDGGGSGPSSSTTTPLTGATTGWTHTASTVSTPAGGPFQSNAFSWVAGTSSAPGELVTTADVAGNAVTTSLSLVDDSTAPAAAATFPAAATYASGSAWRNGCGTSATADLCGDAADTLSGLAFVGFALTRVSDGRCWNPSAQTWTTAACSGVSIPFTAGASPAWTAPFPCATGSYSITVAAADNVGNTLVAPARSWTISSCA